MEEFESIRSARTAGDARPRTRPDADFVCAICLRNISMRWNFGPHPIIPPICSYCESEYSRHVGGRPKAGAFRDRREVMRGFALAEALLSEAYQQTWRGRYVA